EHAAEQLGIRVSYESLQSSVVNGGLCRVKGQYRIIIDKRATSEERVSTIATALGTFDAARLDELALPKKVRELLRLHEPAAKRRTHAA
ncbi:MAG: hypothetical protein ACTHU0_05930, partial [Kofleriaceae bacterium]